MANVPELLTTSAARVRLPLSIGTAGWSIPTALAERVPGTGPHLARYARVLRCAEIDTAFYRPHQVTTYARWAACTPADFRFAVKLPQEITHERRLLHCQEPVDAFLEQVSGLGDKLAVLLLQLPPSLSFDAPVVEDFLELVRSRTAGALACEPRHRSWFTVSAETMMARWHVARVAADPALGEEAARPGGWLGGATEDDAPLRYYRWHGSPQRYWSRYEAAWIDDRLAAVEREGAGVDCWCIFDNTASGAALDNALGMQALSAHRGRHEPLDGIA